MRKPQLPHAFPDHAFHIGPYVVEVPEVGLRAHGHAAPPDLDPYGLHPGHLHGPVPQDERRGPPVDPGAEVGAVGPHGQHGPQPGSSRKSNQPNAHHNSSNSTPHHPPVVKRPSGKLMGEPSPPLHGGPVSTNSSNVVQQHPGRPENDGGHQKGGHPPHGPKPPDPRNRTPAPDQALGRAPASALSALDPAHRTRSRPAAPVCTECSRSTVTATSGTSIPARAFTRSAIRRRTAPHCAPMSEG